MTVSGTTNVANVNFGYVRTPQTASIGDYIWNDFNRDGLQNGGETGLANVKVTLYLPGTDGIAGTGDDVQVAATRTDGNGSYRFNGLGPNASYFVSVDATTVPGGMMVDTQTPSPTPFINLSAGQRYDQADIGFHGTTASALGDRVWYDTNGDSIQQPGEVGIGGVQITISGGPTGFTPVVVTTKADGSWYLAGLQPGSYTAAVSPGTLPAGYNTTPTNGSISRTTTIVANQDAMYIDFGFNIPTGQPAQTNTIGNTVFFDSNGNGIRDAGEPPIAKVTLSLMSAGADAIFGTADDVVLSTTATDANGAYSFSGVQSGTYEVMVTDINGALAGVNLTSGTNPTGTITVTTNQSYTNANFGYSAAGGTIGDTIWHDLNGNGVKDGGEPSLQGVAVNLWYDINGNGVIDSGVDKLSRTTATNINGVYTFGGLPNAAYLVEVAGGQSLLNGFTKSSGAPNTNDNSQPSPYAVTLTAASPTVWSPISATTQRHHYPLAACYSKTTTTTAHMIQRVIV